MISIARIFGAPDTVPAGKHARSASKAVASGSSFPLTLLVICMTWLYRSMVMMSLSSTEPISETRPISFRPRSMSMTCSARSFGSASSPSASSVSSSSVVPRGRVPARGLTVTFLSITRTIISGELPTSVADGVRRQNMNGLGFTTRSVR